MRWKLRLLRSMKRLPKAYGRFATTIGSTSWEEGLDSNGRRNKTFSSPQILIQGLGWSFPSKGFAWP
jgi:hypothetical protein